MYMRSAPFRWLDLLTVGGTLAMSPVHFIDVMIYSGACGLEPPGRARRAARAAQRAGRRGPAAPEPAGRQPDARPAPRRDWRRAAGAERPRDGAHGSCPG